MGMGQSKAFWGYENFIITIMFLVFGLATAERMAVVYLFPFIAPELGLNNTQLGLISGVLSIALGISTVIFSSLSDFLGTKKKMLIAFILLFSISTFASGVIGGFVSLIAIRILMGVMEGPIVPLINATVMAESAPGRRGFNLGFVQSASPLMGAALLPIVAVAIATSLNWRYAFFILAIPGILLALVLVKYMKEPVLHDGGASVEKMPKPSLADYKQIFIQRNVWLSMLISMFYLAFLFAFMSFTPLYLVQYAKWTESQTAIFLGIFGFCMFLWQLIAPWASDRIGRRAALIIFSLASISIPFSILLFHTNFALLVVIMVLATAGMGYQPLSLAVIPAESVPRPFVASAISIIILIAEVVGGSIGPVLSGVLADQYGLVAPFWVVAATGLASFLLSWGIKETAPVKLAKSKTESVENPNIQISHQ